MGKSGLIGATSLSSRYNVTTQYPMDIRQMVESENSLWDLTTWGSYSKLKGAWSFSMYPNMMVSIENSNLVYQLNGPIPIITDEFATEFPENTWLLLATQEWVEDNYVTEGKLPDVSNFITKDVDNLTNYYNKSEVNEAIKNVEVDLTGYATQEWVGEQNYLTEHQDLSSYAQKSEIPTIPTNVSTFTNDAGYLVEEDLTGYATTGALEQMKTEILGEGITETYDTLVEIQNWINGAGVDATKLTEAIAVETKNREDADSGLDSRIQTIENDYLKSANLNGYVTEDTLDSYATQEWVEAKKYLTEHQDLTDYATQEWVENKNYLTEHQDLSEYAKAADIPVIPTNVSSFTNDAGYLIEQDLSDYALKSAIPDVSNYITKDAFTYADGVLTINLD